MYAAGEELLEVASVRHGSKTCLPQLHSAVLVTTEELFPLEKAMPLFLAKSLPYLQGAFQVHRISYRIFGAL